MKPSFRTMEWYIYYWNKPLEEKDFLSYTEQWEQKTVAVNLTHWKFTWKEVQRLYKQATAQNARFVLGLLCYHRYAVKEMDWNQDYVCGRNPCNYAKLIKNIIRLEASVRASFLSNN